MALKDAKYYLHKENYVVKFQFGNYYRFDHLKYIWIQDDYLFHDAHLSGLLNNITEAEALKSINADVDDYPTEIGKTRPYKRTRELTPAEHWQKTVEYNIDYRKKYIDILKGLGIYNPKEFLYVEWQSIPYRTKN